MISYAQNREDVVLARIFDRPSGFYIDVGAASPVHNSVTKHFYDRGWRGINIEPLALWQEELREQRPRDVNLEIGLGGEDGVLEFFDVSATAREESTFSPEIADELRARGLDPVAREVPVRTLATVCEEHVEGDIDFLKVDVEGYELPVLQGADWDRFRPRIVVVESTRPGTGEPAETETQDLLADAGYVPALFDGINTFFAERRDEAARAALRAPAHVLDRFEDHAVEQLRATVAAIEAGRAEDRAAAERAAESARRHIAWLDARVLEAERGAVGAEQRSQTLAQRLHEAENDVRTARNELADAEVQLQAVRGALERAAARTP